MIVTMLTTPHLLKRSRNFSPPAVAERAMARYLRRVSVAIRSGWVGLKERSARAVTERRGAIGLSASRSNFPRASFILVDITFDT